MAEGSGEDGGGGENWPLFEGVEGERVRRGSMPHKGRSGMENWPSMTRYRQGNLFFLFHFLFFFFWGGVGWVEGGWRGGF